MYSDQFGFIPYDVEIEWSDGRIWPVSEFKKNRHRLDQFSTSDRFYCPPADGGRVPLYRLPPSHHIEVPGLPGQTLDEIRNTQRGTGGFLIQFIGLLFGHRCQFRGWWVDGKTYLKKGTDYYTPPREAGECVDRALSTWRQWGDRARLIAVNALYLHGQTRKYAWLWEQFQAEYQVLDSGFRIAEVCYQVPRGRHGNRINALCNQFGLAKNHAHVEKIVELRNELIHEAVWAGDMPGWPPSGARAHYPRHLHQFNQRLLLALLGIEADYIESEWWGYQPHHFFPRF